MITGATGCGKSFIASALGDRACRQGSGVIYFGMQKLLSKLKIVRMSLLRKPQKTILQVCNSLKINRHI